MEYHIHQRHVRNGTYPVADCEWCVLMLADKFEKIYPRHRPGPVPGEQAGRWPRPQPQPPPRPADRLADETSQGEESAARWGAFMDYVLDLAEYDEFEVELSDVERKYIREWLGDADDE